MTEALTFSFNGQTVVMHTSRGDVSLDRECAEKWLDLHRAAHDSAMRSGDFLAAREARRAWLDLDLALNPPPARIPTLQPITTTVATLNPACWGDAA